MKKSEIKKLLHQREPYVMVDEVSSIDEKSITTFKTPAENEAYVQGHFPGAPVIPGAMLQEICTQSAGILLTKFYSPVEDYDSEKTKGHALGVLNKVEGAKFFDVTKVKDGAVSAKVELLGRQDNLFKFKAKIEQGGVLKAKFKFNLMNISDHYLF